MTGSHLPPTPRTEIAKSAPSRRRLRPIAALVLSSLMLSSLALLACEPKSEPLPTLGKVPALALETQTKRKFSANDFSGGTSVVAFFFTRCPSVCPKLVATMKEVAKETPKKTRFVLVSVDPENDTPDVLRAYAKDHGLGDNFTLLSGDPKKIVEIAEAGFKIGVSGAADPSKEHFGLTHGSHLVLVDRDAAIRGYYRSFDPEALAQLKKDLGGLE